MSTASNISKPMVWPALWNPVCMPASPVATTLMRTRLRTCSSSASTPSVLATRMRRRLSPYPADTCTIDDPAERAASSMRRSSSTFAALGTSSG